MVAAVGRTEPLEGLEDRGVDLTGVGDVAIDIELAGDVPNHHRDVPRPVRLHDRGADAGATADHNREGSLVVHGPRL